MLNKLINGIIFSCLCVSVFSQDISADRIKADAFISNFYWYQKYLPQENIAELYIFRNSLVLLRENDDGEFDRLSGVLSVKIQEFDAKVFDKLQREMVQKNTKMNTLLDRYETDAEIKELSSRYSVFKTIIAEHTYPENDICLDIIEEYYSQRITRPGYKLSNQRTGGNKNREPKMQTYITKNGDYFRKIAANPDIYNDEYYWKYIYHANKDNKNLLLNPDNPDLIYPGVAIQIPLLPVE